MVRAQHLELGDELCVIAQEQLRLDASLDGGEPKLVEAVRLELEGEAPGDVGERVPPPQCERRPQSIGRLDGARLDKGQGRCDGFLEAPLVDAAGVDVEAVAATFPHDHVAELHPEVRDVRLQRRARARGRALAPEAFEQGIRGDDTAGVCGEQREHGALLRSS